MLPLSGKVFLLLLIVITVVAFYNRAKYLISLLSLGKPEDRSDQPNERWKFTLGQVLTQRCALKNVTTRDLSGIGHALLFFGFSYFATSYGVHIAEGFYEKLTPALLGSTVNNLFFLLLDIAGLVVITSIVWAAIRRYIVKPARLKPSKEAGVILLVVLSLMVLSFCVEGFRLLAEEKPFADWAFVGIAFSQVFKYMGLQAQSQPLFYFFWFFHLMVVFGFGIYILYSKHLHILASHPNLYYHSTRAKGSLKAIENFEEAESFGVSKLTDFSWKHLLDFYACTECGQCSANCPAYNTNKPLSPRDVILHLKEHLLTTGKEMLTKAPDAGQEEAEGEPAAMIGSVVSQDEIWDCTNCMACMEVCPVAIEHVDKIDDMRRYLVLMESNFPPEVQVVFRNMENNSNPWGLGMATRGDWVKDLGVKVLSEDSNVDLLYYVGCAGAFDERYKKVSTAMVRILQAAGINFGILGAEEKCCGDSARRIGNEYLYQTMAQENIEVFKAYNVKKIVTTCPHGFNTLKNEYPQFGGEFEVMHHTELILDLIKKGSIKLEGELAKKITLHDSCFLGRYNDIYNPPREILGSVPKARLVEMEKIRRTSFCCGAGGGRMWMEEGRGKKINETRTEEALSRDPDLIATACPFCMTMFEDGLKAKNAEEKVKVLDIAEVVANHLLTK
jgi:Fe-S oxidoreductase